MQLRMSPGGSMLSSLRRRPLEPPSSLTVTTAQSSLISGWSGWPSVAGPGDVTLESFEQGGEAGAAADGDHVQAAV